MLGFPGKLPSFPLESLQSGIHLSAGQMPHGGSRTGGFSGQIKDFRYSHRSANGFNDGDRSEQALKGIVGKRLTYARPDLDA
jgi:hypothetical protein